MRRAKVASFLLLTLPGVPFVYYGEEIGMLGDKPDERLRTPMQWSTARGAGFTRGKPWEQLQVDSATTTVAAQEHDSSSLLSLHRRLIHLRAQNAALAEGRLVPLEANSDGVAAFLRRSGSSAVLSVANLREDDVRAVTLTSAANSLEPGTYALRDMLGSVVSGKIVVEADGAIRNAIPLTLIPGLRFYLFELTRAR